MTDRTRGFTLIELLIVVTIIGILAAIALPAYDGYARRGNRTVAKTVLAEIASRQESFFTDRKSYAETLAALGYAVDGSGNFVFSKNGTPVAAATNAIYTVSMTATPAGGPTFTAFTATATAVAGSQQAKDTGCTTLSLTNTGTKSPLGDCWTR